MRTTGSATARDLPQLVDAIVAEPLDGLDEPALQALIAALTPQVARLQGWLQVAAGRLAHLTGGTLLADDDSPHSGPRSVAGWLADVQHSTPGAAGSQLRTVRLLESLPLVVDAVLDGRLTPAQAAVLTRLVGKIDDAALAESQPAVVEVASAMDPAQLGVWVSHQIATHWEPVFDDEQARARDRRFLSSRREADGTLRGSSPAPIPRTPSTRSSATDRWPASASREGRRRSVGRR